MRERLPTDEGQSRPMKERLRFAESRRSRISSSIPVNERDLTTQRRHSGVCRNPERTGIQKGSGLAIRCGRRDSLDPRVLSSGLVNLAVATGIRRNDEQKRTQGGHTGPPLREHPNRNEFVVAAPPRGCPTVPWACPVCVHPDEGQPRGQGRTHRSVLDNHVLPEPGGVPAAALGRGEVSALHHRLRSTPSRANAAVDLLSEILTLAGAWELTPPGRNPCRGLRRYGTRPRERFLSDEEFRRLGRGLKDAEAEGAPVLARSRPSGSETLSAVAKTSNTSSSYAFRRAPSGSNIAEREATVTGKHSLMYSTCNLMPATARSIGR